MHTFYQRTLPITLIIRKWMVLMKGYAALSPFISRPLLWVQLPKLFRYHLQSAAISTLKLNLHLIPKWDCRRARWQGKTGMWTTRLWLTFCGYTGELALLGSVARKFNQASVEKRISCDHIHEKCHPLNKHSRFFILRLYLPPASLLHGNWVFLEQFLISARSAMSQVAQTLSSKSFTKDII